MGWHYSVSANYKCTFSYCTCKGLKQNLQGAVGRYCFDMKLINLLACFIMKYDVLCYDTRIKMADHGQQCTIVYEL